MHKPTTLHLQHLKRFLSYLKSTMNYGILLRKPTSLNLLAYTDIIILNIFRWKSYLMDIQKAKSVARSSTEEKYRAIATGATELMWLLKLLQELRVHYYK